MRPILLAAATLTLAACATTTDLAGTEPDDIQLSTKPVEEVSRCLQLLADKPERTDPHGNRMIEIRNGMNFILATITLIPIETGTRMEMRRANSFNILGPWRGCA